MKVSFTYTTKIYKISLNIFVVFIVLILVEKLGKDYNSVKFSILKKTCKRPKILSRKIQLWKQLLYTLFANDYHHGTIMY